MSTNPSIISKVSSWLGKSEILHPHQVHDFKRLKQVEASRRDLLNRSKSPNKQQLYLQLWGTVWPYVVTSWETWLCIAVYIITRLTLIYQWTNQLIEVDMRFVTTIGGFLSFLLVFFTNQTYSRYIAQYENCMRMEGRILNSAYYARNHLPTERAWQYIRYLNGSQVLAYVGISNTYEEDNFFHQVNENLQFFNEEEVAILHEMNMDAGGICYREVLCWASKILSEEYESKRLEQFVYVQMMSELLQLRGSIGTLFDFADQPIPFIYLHLIHFLLLFYLPFFSYVVAMAFDPSSGWANVFGCMLVILNTMFNLGMRIIAHVLSNPYDEAVHNFSVMHYLNFTMMSSRRILVGHTVAATSLEQEAILEGQRPMKGSGFTDGVGRPRPILVSKSESFRAKTFLPPSESSKISSNPPSAPSSSRSQRWFPQLSGRIQFPSRPAPLQREDSKDKISVALDQSMSDMEAFNMPTTTD